MSAGVATVFWVVVLSRLFVPLLIPKWPLPAIFASLVIDGIDQSIFQAFGYNPPGYQGYDKAMDVYYLAVAYIASMRNWTSPSAFGITRFLYFYRLVGVTAFELTQVRALLLVFPNTFEYFFIAYEGIRTRWNPLRFSRRWWLWTAGLIWVFVKLPQEYWIHVAQLDFTDTWKNVSWFAPLIITLVLIGCAVLWFVVRPRLWAPDWSWRFSADPLPEEMDEAAERDAWTAAHGRVLGSATFEKVVLVGLISVIFGQVVPDVQASNLQLFIAMGVLVVINAGLSLALARQTRGVESVLAAFGLRALANLAVVFAGEWLLNHNGGSLNRVNVVFFVLLLSLLTTLHDRYRPVHGARVAAAASEAAGQTGASLPT